MGWEGTYFVALGLHPHRGMEHNLAKGLPTLSYLEDDQSSLFCTAKQSAYSCIQHRALATTSVIRPEGLAESRNCVRGVDGRPWTSTMESKQRRMSET